MKRVALIVGLLLAGIWSLAQAQTPSVRSGAVLKTQPAVVSTANACNGTGLATWDAAALGSNISPPAPGNLVLIAGSTDVNTQSHSTISHSSGKCYSEHIVAVGLTADTFAIGAAKSTASLATYSGNVNSSGLFGVSGTPLANNVAGSVINTYSSSGTVIPVAVDLDHSRIWWKTGCAGNWNNNGSADPATNVGGFDISSITGGPILMTVTLGSTSYSVNSDFGPSYTCTVPSGFGMW